MIGAGYERAVPKGKHARSAAWVQAVFKASDLSQEAFAEKIGVSRGGLTKWLSGEQRPRFDSIEKLRKVAPPHLQDPENLDPVVKSAITTRLSDPRATVPPASDAEQPGGYTVTRTETRLIAEQLDAITDDDLRGAAANAAWAAILKVKAEAKAALGNPQPPIAERRPGRGRSTS